MGLELQILKAQTVFRQCVCPNPDFENAIGSVHTVVVFLLGSVHTQGPCTLLLVFCSISLTHIALAHCFCI